MPSVKNLDADDGTSLEQDGRGDFDFLHGRWRSENQRLVDPLDPHCNDWIAFEASWETRPIMDGLGCVDSFQVAALPDGRPFEALTLRLFDPEARRWRIWWASTSRPGHVDPPMEGSFTDGQGLFFGDDVLKGQPVKVRFDWTDITPTSARFQQAFSYDEGRTWKPNWIITLTRAT